MRTEEIMAKLQAKYPTEKEYLQAVREVLECIEDVYNSILNSRTHESSSASWSRTECLHSVLLGLTTRARFRQTPDTVYSSTTLSDHTREVSVSILQ